MGAMLEEFLASGVRLAALPGGKLQATGVLDDGLRERIRTHKTEILTELNRTSFRWRVGHGIGGSLEVLTVPEQTAHEMSVNYPPGASIEALPELVSATPTEISEQWARIEGGAMPDDRRPCTACDNFLNGRCASPDRLVLALPEWPVPSQPRRCLGYRAGADEIDQRTGRRRWAAMFPGSLRNERT